MIHECYLYVDNYNTDFRIIKCSEMISLGNKMEYKNRRKVRGILHHGVQNVRYDNKLPIRIAVLYFVTHAITTIHII